MSTESTSSNSITKHDILLIGVVIAVCCSIFSIIISVSHGKYQCFENSNYEHQIDTNDIKGKIIPTKSGSTSNQK